MGFEEHFEDLKKVYKEITEPENTSGKEVEEESDLAKENVEGQDAKEKEGQN